MNHRYAIICTDTGDELRRYTSNDAQRAKAHGAQPGCRLKLLPQVRKPNPYQTARAIVADLGLTHFPF